VSWFLRIDGEETDLVGGRLVWERGWCVGRAGFVFHLAAHGGRRVLHVAGWAPAEVIGDLSNQVVKLEVPGPDAAVDGRFFSSVEIRFGRVTDSRAVLSIDGEVEDIDPASPARSLIEADIALAVQEELVRRFCMGCGVSLARWQTPTEEFVGGLRVRRVAAPLVCPACEGYSDAPRFCPACGAEYRAGDVRVLSDAESVGYTGSCRCGRVLSGQLPAVGNR
jgi:hypothetical protein